MTWQYMYSFGSLWLIPTEWANLNYIRLLCYWEAIVSIEIRPTSRTMFDWFSFNWVPLTCWIYNDVLYGGRLAWFYDNILFKIAMPILPVLWALSTYVTHNWCSVRHWLNELLVSAVYLCVIWISFFHTAASLLNDKLVRQTGIVIKTVLRPDNNSCISWTWEQ